MNRAMDNKQLKNPTIKHVFSYSLAVGTTQILMIFYTVILMRWVGPGMFGIISANYATTLLLSFLINWGMNEWLVKAIPTSDDPRSVTGSIIQFKFIFGIIWVLLIWTFLPLVQPGIYQRYYLAIILFDVWLDSCFNLFIADRIGNERIFSASTLLVASRVLRLLSLLFLICLGNRSITYILIARFISTFLFFVIAWIIVKPKVIKHNNFHVRDVFKQSTAFNKSEMLNLIFAQIDINILTWMVGDATLIGAFAFVITLINMVMTIPSGIYNLLIPGSVKTFNSKPNLFRKRMRTVLFSFLAIGAVVFLVIVLPGTEWMTKFLGNDYLLSTQLLLLAAPILFLRVINQFNNVYLVSVGRAKSRILPQIIVVLLKVAIGIIVVVKWQAIGLIMLGIMVEAILLLLYSIQSFKHFKNKVEAQII